MPEGLNSEGKTLPRTLPQPRAGTEAELLRRRIEESINAKRALLADGQTLSHVLQAAHLIDRSLRTGRKVLFAGNGGSAMDAGHLAAELLGRFYVDRAPLAAVNLSDSVAAMTAIANDYSYDEVFSRQLRGLGRPDDVFFGLSTSGRSANILAGMRAARAAHLHTVGITGADGGDLVGECDVLIRVPSTDTPRVQELSMLLGHTICELVERRLIGAS